MGCDIHMYLEHSSNGKYWKALTDNAGSRDYAMFGIVAGVRVDDIKIFEPKGMPDGEWSYVTRGAYWLNVAPAAHPEWADLDSYVSPENAQRYIEYGSKAEYDDAGALRRVAHPDWHSHSWLTTEEVGRAIAEYESLSREVAWGRKAPTEWFALHAAMQAIEARDEQTRLIFWFDN